MTSQPVKRAFELVDDKPSVAAPREKRKRPASGTIPISRGRFKQRWLSKHSSLIKRADSAYGIMVTCPNRTETRAMGQIQQFLTKFLDEAFSTATSTWTRPDCAFEIESDEESVPINENRPDRKIEAVDTACGGLVFYRLRVDVTPSTFVDRMFAHFAQIKNAKEREKQAELLRFTARWLPIDYVCPATTDRITLCFEKRVIPDRIAKFQPKTSIAIIAEVRNSPLSKKEVIDLVANLLPSTLTVDLSRPQYVIFVTVFKSVCGIGILHKYYERKKFNLLQQLKSAE
ncbi:hypothetical protein BC940DRAFT_313433 [Gongronella butleri]|nr:hypothetical protein BC940DRAFT_313433 [Gongronella butleri]